MYYIHPGPHFLSRSISNGGLNIVKSIMQHCIDSRLLFCVIQMKTRAWYQNVFIFFPNTAFKMNAVYKAHFQTLSYSRKLVVTRMKREPTGCDRLSSFFCNEALLLPSSRQTSLSRLIVPSPGFTRNIHVLTDDDIRDISSNEIRRITKSSFAGYQEGFTCVAVNCPSCNHASSTTIKDANNDLGKLYINLRTGYSFCTQCFLSGPWSNLAKYIQALDVFQLKSEKAKSCKGTDMKSFDRPHIKCDSFLSGPPRIAQHLSLYTDTTSMTEANEMKGLWNLAQPIHSLSEETLGPFLDKLRLGVGRRTQISVVIGC